MEPRRFPGPDDKVIEAIRRLKGGEGTEIDHQILVDRLRPTLVTYFRRHQSSAAYAEDLAQETLSKVFPAIASLREERSFFGWLFQIARNTRLRFGMSSSGKLEGASKGLEDSPAAGLPDGGQNPLGAAVAGERLDRVRRAIERLPRQQKQCLLLRVLHDMSYEEIGTLLRLNSRTVRNHLREARLNLRKHVDEA